MSNSSNSYNVTKQKLDGFFRPIGSPLQRHLANNGYEDPEILRMNHRAAELKPVQKSLVRPTNAYAQELVTPADSLQAAISRVATTGGGRVVLTGYHSVTEQILLPEGVSIEGIDVFNTIIDFGSTTANILLDGTTGSNLANFTIQNCAADACITTSNSSTTTISNIYFLNNSGFSVSADSSSKVILENLLTENSGGFFNGTGETESVLATNCGVYDTEFGIVGNSFNFSSFLNCDLHCSVKALSGVIDASYFANNHFTQSDSGGTVVAHLLTTESDNNTFEGNIFQGIFSGDRALILESAPLNKFTGNTFVSNGADAVLIKTANDNTFSGNRITGNGAGKFSVNIEDASCDRTVVVGNNLETLGTAADPIQDNGTNTIGFGTALNAT